MSSTRLLSMRAAAEHLAIDYDTFRAYVKRGLIAAVRYPSLYRQGPRRTKLFQVEELDRFILESQEESNETRPSSSIPAGRTVRPYPKDWHEKLSR